LAVFLFEILAIIWRLVVAACLLEIPMESDPLMENPIESGPLFPHIAAPR